MITCQSPSEHAKIAHRIIRIDQMTATSALVHLSESECKVCPLSEHATLFCSGVQFGYWDILAHRNPKLFVQRSSMLDGLLDPVGMLGHAFANSTRLLFLQ